MPRMTPYKRPDRDGYWFKFRDYSRPGGPWRQVKGGSTYEGAVIAQARAIERSIQIRDGIITPQQLRDADRMAAPIPELLEDWQSSMEGRRVDASKIKTWVRYVELITEDRMPPRQRGGNRANAKAGSRGRNAILCLSELDANAIDKYLKRLMDKPYSRGVRTRNEYLTALKAFIAWVRGTSSGCPLSMIGKLNPKKDPRVPRRGLTVDEFDRLVACIPDTAQGRGRAWYRAFYLVAGRCGGRWSEIAKLRVEHIHDGYIHFDAEITKTGESGDVEMLPEVEAAISRITQMRVGGLLFGGKPARRTFERHLAAAGIPYRLDGRVVSLRMTLASQLIAAGAIPAELKRIMRHSSITTTYGYYNDIALTTGGGALGRLGAPGPRGGQISG